MTKYPGARYQTARELVEAIDEVRTGRFVFARESKEEPSPPLLPPIPWGRIASLIILGTMLGIGVHFLWPGLTGASSGKAAEDELGPGVEWTTEATDFKRFRVSSPPPEDGHEYPDVGDPPELGDKVENDPEDDVSDSFGFLARRGTRDEALRTVARRFQQCIAKGALDDALEYVQSDVQLEPEFQYTLTHYADFIGAKDLIPGRSVIRQDGDLARGILMFRARSGASRWALQIELVRENGEWRVKRFVERQQQERQE
jgi:hypothetical protein